MIRKPLKEESNDSTNKGMGSKKLPLKGGIIRGEHLWCSTSRHHPKGWCLEPWFPYLHHLDTTGETSADGKTGTLAGSGTHRGDKGVKDSKSSSSN